MAGCTFLAFPPVKFSPRHGHRHCLLVIITGRFYHCRIMEPGHFIFGRPDVIFSTCNRCHSNGRMGLDRFDIRIHFLHRYHAVLGHLADVQYLGGAGGEPGGHGHPALAALASYRSPVFPDLTLEIG